MRKVSKSQSHINKEIDKIKKSLSPFCIICGCPANDGAHLLPRSLYMEYQTQEWNIVPMCRKHHEMYDGNREFRRSCTELVNRVKEHDEQAANRYFGL